MAYATDSVLVNMQQTVAVKAGIVYYKPPKICLQPWPAGCIKQYWCELHRESSNHPRQLVLVEMPKSTKKSVETIPLDNVFKINPKEGLMKGKSIFQIMTSNGKFTLATDSLEDTANWIDILKEELFGPPKHGVVYEYRVKVQKNYKGDMPYGDYLLRVYNKEIRLFTSNGLIPTGFKCFIRDIHKVKYQGFGPQECCVTISIKNAQTNNKEVNILILDTKSASEVAKVISYRKKNLVSQDELDALTTGHNKDSPAFRQKYLDELNQKLQGISITSKSTANTKSLPNLALKRQNAVYQNKTPASDTARHSITSEIVNNNDVTFESPESGKEQHSQSLPRIYNLPTNPSIDSQNGDIFGDSFDLRAPKRQKEIKVKERSYTAPHKTIRDRPPAAIPESSKTSVEDLQDCETIDSDTSSISHRSTILYDCVKPDILRSLGAFKAKVMESQDDDSDKGYVVNSIIQSYLQVLSPEEEGIYAFKPEES